jgi:hypothetical protein
VAGRPQPVEPEAEHGHEHSERQRGEGAQAGGDESDDDLDGEEQAQAQLDRAGHRGAHQEEEAGDGDLVGAAALDRSGVPGQEGGTADGEEREGHRDPDDLGPVAEKDDLQHGVFTYYLLEGLRGAADSDRDGMITVDEAYRYVSEKVPRATSMEQHPVKKGMVEGTLVISLAN